MLLLIALTGCDLLMAEAVDLLSVDRPVAATAEPAPTAAPADALAPVGPLVTGQGFAKLRAQGELRVAADPNARPFLFRAEDGGYQGFEWSLISEIGRKANVSVRIVETLYDQLPARLQNAEADLIIGQFSPSTDYSGLAYSVSYLQYSMCLIVPAQSSVRSPAELRGRRVATYDDPVATQLANVLVGGKYAPRLYNDYGYLDDMVNGQLDAMFYDCPLARAELEDYRGRLQIVDDRLNVATYNVAVRADQPELLADVNGVLKELGDAGLLSELETLWLGGAAPAESYQAASVKVLVVKRGDTLTSLAEQELGSRDRWKDLYDENRDIIGPDPNLIYVGISLRVPGTNRLQGAKP